MGADWLPLNQALTAQLILALFSRTWWWGGATQALPGPGGQGDLKSEAVPACPQPDVAQLIPVSPLPATQERKGLAACNCAHAGWGSRREAGGGQRGGGMQQGGARLGWD